MATYAQRAEALRNLVLTMRPDLADPSEAIKQANHAMFTGRLTEGPYIADGHGVPGYNYVNLGLRRPDANVSVNLSVYADPTKETKAHMAWIDGKQTGDYDAAAGRMGEDPKAIARRLVTPEVARRLAYASAVYWALKRASGILSTIALWEERPRARWTQRQLRQAERNAPDQLRELIEAEAAYRALTPTT